jgi:hypothetical protein
MKPGLTPDQQNLMQFLNKLASSPYSVELMQEGNQILDSAVAEVQELQQNIDRVSNAVRTARRCANE